MKNIIVQLVKISFITLFCIISVSSLQAQTKTFCGLDELLRKRDLSNDKTIQERAFHSETAPVKKINGSGDIIYLKTVVHVLYNNTQYISDSEIETLIEDLNKIFRKEINTTVINPSLLPVAADSRIQFCLAQTDPDGNSTNGVNQVETSVTSFSEEIGPVEQIKTDSLGGASPWNTDEYFNIWIGQASGPDVAVNWGVPQTNYMPLGQFLDEGITPGVVLDYETVVGFLPTPAANVLAHECGHALGLQHTHGDPTDFSMPCEFDDAIEDTPLCGFPFDPCGTPNVNSCIETDDDPLDNLSNIMYYECAVMITAQQGQRMYDNVTTLGPDGFILSECDAIPLSANFDAISAKTICVDGDVDFEYQGTGATSWEWTFEGGTPGNSTEETPAISYGQAGTYNVELIVSDGTNNNTVTEMNFITVLPQPTAVITQNNPATSSTATDGSVQAEVFDGVTPYTFELLPDNTINTTGFFDGLPVGDYSVSIYNDDTQCFVEVPFSIEAETTSLTVLEQQMNEVIVLPNPNDGNFEVLFPEPFSQEVKLSLLDLTGREITRTIVMPHQSYSKNWNLTELPAGMYFLKLETDGKVNAKKIIIK